ncbi:hypothetical protein FHE72_20450 [Rossellomorea vietnamensis]|uniref:Uncharacterized protein n=1 Tax=Rossellomorea vietnamensis TaxID=218284 RepID=A0A6I6UVG8_9BACI|nr:hypothetical protein [Rossellomorea vietnamensis]QHE63112.1 hypothetical protein FHE72_20450 [Rossellomorea vietnamensis]
MNDNELIINKLLSETLIARVETKVLKELLIENLVLTHEQYENKFNQLRDELTENHLTKELNITAEELRELVIGN